MWTYADFIEQAATALNMQHLASMGSNTTLVEARLDSLALAELLAWGEDSYGVSVDDRFLEATPTLGEVWQAFENAVRR